MYAQDYAGKFPAGKGPAYGFEDLQPLINTGYVTTMKLFICPSNKEDKAATGTVLTPNNLSYAYGWSLTESSSEDTCLMVDQSGAKRHVGYGSLSWREDLTPSNPSPPPNYFNHGSDGVNALYIDNHVEWVNKSKIPERIKQSFFEPGNLKNPGAWY